MKLYYVKDPINCIIGSVEVIREGILPGCSAFSITVRYPDGYIAQTAREYFCETEADAYHEAVLDLTKALHEAFRRESEAVRDIAKIRKELYGGVRC